MLSNQWIGLQYKTTIQHRIEVASQLDALASGGSICHINLESKFQSDEMAWKMLNHMAKNNVLYFAFCNKISACEDNHGFHGDICDCGKPKVTEFSRIVGFMTNTQNFSSPRKAEFAKRQWNSIGEVDA